MSSQKHWPRWQACWRGGALWLLAVSLLSPVHGQTSERELTVAGALHLATQLLAKDAKQPLGQQLARLVVALEPGHEEALLLLSAVQDQQPIAEPSEQIMDQGQTFGGFLLRQGDEQAKQSGPSAQAWANLYYGLGLSLAPRHERALSLALQLKRPLNDLGVEALLAAVTPPVAPVAGTPATPGEGPTATGPPATAGEIEQRLRAIAVPELEISGRQPVPAINLLNRLLVNSGVFIRPKVAGFRIQGGSKTDGVFQFSAVGEFERPADEHFRWRFLRLHQTNAWRALQVLCRHTGLGYKIVGQEVHVVSRESPGAIFEKVISVTADALTSEFSSSQPRAMSKYKDQLVEVVGLLDAYAEPTLGRTTLTLIGDRVRLIFGKDEELQGSLTDVKTAYEKERTRLAKINGSGNSAWAYTEQTREGRGGIELVVVGRCTGYRGGRVILEECQEPTWRQR